MCKWTIRFTHTRHTRACRQHQYSSYAHGAWRNDHDAWRNFPS